MTTSVLVLDTVSCIIIAVTMPAFAVAFATFSSQMRKTLKKEFKGIFRSQEITIHYSSNLLCIGCMTMSLLYLFEAIAQGKVESWISNMVINNNGGGYDCFLFLSTLMTEQLLYFAVIKTVKKRRGYDWNKFLMLNIKPRPEQNILKKLYEETEANRLHEELLESDIMDDSQMRGDLYDESFDFTQSPTVDRSHRSNQSIRPIPFAIRTMRDDKSSTESQDNESLTPLVRNLHSEKKLSMHQSTPLSVPGKFYDFDPDSPALQLSRGPDEESQYSIRLLQQSQKSMVKENYFGDSEYALSVIPPGTK